MGKADIKGKVFFDDKYYFADTCNAVLYGRREVVDPYKLEKLPNSVISYDENNEMQRDILKKAKVMSDGRQIYVIFGIENMKDFDYAFIVRDGSYYFMSLSGQIREIRSLNRGNWKNEKPRG